MVSKDALEFVPWFLQREKWKHERRVAGAMKSVLRDEPEESVTVKAGTKNKLLSVWIVPLQPLVAVSDITTEHIETFTVR